MGVPVLCRSWVHVKCTRSSVQEGAKNALLRIIKPDLSITIQGDARSMRTMTGSALSGISIFGDTIIRPSYSFFHIEFADHAYPSFCPPDIAIRIDSD